MRMGNEGMSGVPLGGWPLHHKGMQKLTKGRIPIQLDQSVCSFFWGFFWFWGFLGFFSAFGLSGIHEGARSGR